MHIQMHMKTYPIRFTQVRHSKGGKTFSFTSLWALQPAEYLRLAYETITVVRTESSTLENTAKFLLKDI